MRKGYKFLGSGLILWYDISNRERIFGTRQIFKERDFFGGEEAWTGSIWLQIGSNLRELVTAVINLRVP
jgi:hypothetical protein